VLDRDDGLSGEVLHQLNLLVGERPRFLPVDDDKTGQLIVLEHRHAHDRTRASLTEWPGKGSAAASAVGQIFLVRTPPSRILPGVGTTTSRRLLNSASFGGVLTSAAKRSLSPSRRKRVPNLASQSRVAFSSMALNTGSSSPGDELMTRSTSEVAVCWSNDSDSSRVRCCSASNSRTFSMAITAWSAKVSTSA